MFRTPIGFHDAYVAAPSQKAALEAWGADSNLFAQGIAEQVTEPELIAEALATPGEVIRRLRGSAGEQVEALAREERGARPLPRSRSARVALSSTGKRDGKEKRGGPSPSAASQPLPLPLGGRGSVERRPERPDRGEVEAAEATLAEAGKRQRAELRAIEREMEALERRRRETERRHERERDALTEERDRARVAYERAMRAWERG